MLRECVIAFWRSSQPVVYVCPRKRTCRFQNVPEIWWGISNTTADHVRSWRVALFIVICETSRFNVQLLCSPRVSMGPADSSRIFSWIKSQSAIAHSHHQDPQDSGSFPQCCGALCHQSSKSICPPQALQAITPPTSVQNRISRKRRHSMPATERSSSPRKRPRRR